MNASYKEERAMDREARLQYQELLGEQLKEGRELFRQVIRQSNMMMEKSTAVLERAVGALEQKSASDAALVSQRLNEEFLH